MPALPAGPQAGAHLMSRATLGVVSFVWRPPDEQSHAGHRLFHLQSLPLLQARKTGGPSPGQVLEPEFEPASVETCSHNGPGLWTIPCLPEMPALPKNCSPPQHQGPSSLLSLCPFQEDVSGWPEPGLRDAQLNSSDPAAARPACERGCAREKE